MARTGPDPDVTGGAPVAPIPEQPVPDVPPGAAAGAVPDATQPVAQAPAPGSPPRAPEVAPRHRAGKGRVRRVVGWLVRTAVLVIVVAGIGAGIYFGWPVVYDRYLAPVQTNTADVGILRDQVIDLQRQVDDLVAVDSTVDARLGSIDERLAELDAMDATLAATDTAAAADVSRQVRLLMGMELMSRARLFMFQANYGLAEQDVQAARDILAGIADEASAAEAASISEAVRSLDRVLTALPAFPVAARDDLDIAWLALLGRVPTENASAEPSPTPVP